MKDAVIVSTARTGIGHVRMRHEGEHAQGRASGEDDEDAKRKQAHHHTGATDIDQCRGLQECRVDDRNNRADCHKQEESDRFRAPANEVTQPDRLDSTQILLILRRTH